MPKPHRFPPASEEHKAQMNAFFDQPNFSLVKKIERGVTCEFNMPLDPNRRNILTAFLRHIPPKDRPVFLEKHLPKLTRNLTDLQKEKQELLSHIGTHVVENIPEENIHLIYEHLSNICNVFRFSKFEGEQVKAVGEHILKFLGKEELPVFFEDYLPKLFHFELSVKQIEYFGEYFLANVKGRQRKMLFEEAPRLIEYYGKKADKQFFETVGEMLKNLPEEGGLVRNFFQSYLPVVVACCRKQTKKEEIDFPLLEDDIKADIDYDKLDQVVGALKNIKENFLTNEGDLVFFTPQNQDRVSFPSSWLPVFYTSVFLRVVPRTFNEKNRLRHMQGNIFENAKKLLNAYRPNAKLLEKFIVNPRFFFPR